MTDVMGVPPGWGFGPHSTAVTGGLHAQRSAGGDCSVSSGVLSPGVIRRGAGPWRGTFAAARRRGDRLAHTVLRTRSVLMCSKIGPRFSNASILGGFPTRHHHRAWRERRGVIHPRVRGPPPEARVNGPGWTERTIMRHALKRRKRLDSKPPAAHSVGVCSASDALSPTRERVALRTTHR